MTDTKMQQPPPSTLMTIEQAFQRAVTHHKAGHLQDAEYLYRIILQFQPDHPDVPHNISLLEEQVKLATQGLEQFNAVLEASPEQAEHWFNYIDALLVTGQIEIAQQVLQVGRKHGLQGEMLSILAERLEYDRQRAKQSWNQIPAEELLQIEKINLKNNVIKTNDKSTKQSKKYSSKKIKTPSSQQTSVLINLFNKGEYIKVISLSRKMTKNYPGYAFGWRMLGTALQQTGRNKEALLPLQKVVKLAPDDAETRKNTLVDLFNKGKYTEVIQLSKQMTEDCPNYAFGWKVLGSVLKQIDQSKDALLSLKKAVEFSPDDAEAHNNLAITLNELEFSKEAEISCRRSLQLDPESAETHNTLGIILQALNRLDEAEASYQHALQIKPNYTGACNNLSNTLQEQGRLDEAKDYCHKALKVDPNYASAHLTLGNIYRELEQLDKAEACFVQAIKIKPNLAEAYNNLGNILQTQGRLDESETCYRKTLEIKPNFISAQLMMGNVSQDLGKLNKAESSFRKVIEAKPNDVSAYHNLGNTLQILGRLDEAEACCRKALEIDPGSALAYINLGNTLHRLGRFDETETCFQQALKIESGDDLAFRNLLFTINYHPDKTAEEIFKVYQEYNNKYCLFHQAEWQPHNNSRDIQRRLKIGYVSPDFRNHSVHYFIEPLLAHHNKQAVEVYAYAELTKEDLVSARFKDYVDHWIPTIGVSDIALTERIRADDIDILVDLAGHTAKTRLQVFARKPTPVSISWLGYGYTTGLTAIDYFLTDITTVPLGSEALFSETPYRIATPSFSYRPAEGMGEVNVLPASTKGYVTFGTLTRPVRINHRTIRVWSEILKQVPNSQLIIDSRSFSGKYMQDMLADKFAAHGITRERLQIGYHSPPWDVLRSTDIGLDCFPHNSGATLFETLYMGVPYITLAGRPSVGRLGSCILHGLGHSEWIAESEEDYVNKAVELASDLNHLSVVRATLRNQMENSPLRDEKSFALKVEQAYRTMWETWCTKGRGN